MPKTPITPEDLYQFKFVEDPQYSPDGQHLAFVRVTVDKAGNEYKRQIWLTELASGNSRAFTASGKSDYAPRWSPDGTRLAFVSTRGGKPQIYLIALNGGEARALTSTANGATNPVWNPNGTRLAFFSSANAEERAQEDRGESPPPPTDALEAKQRGERQEQVEKDKADPRIITRFPYRTGTSFYSDRRQHIYVIEAKDDPAPPRRLTDGELDFEFISWSSDGRDIFSTQSLTPETDPWRHWAVIRVAATGKRKPYKIITRPGYDHYEPHPSPDGQWLAFLWRLDEGSFGRNVFLAVRPSNGGETRNLTLSLDRTVNSYQWSADSKALYFTLSDYGDIHLYRIELETGHITKLVAGTRMIQGFSVSAEGDLAFTASTPKGPADVYVIRSGKERRLTTFNEALLKQRDLAAIEEIRYRSTDGYELQGWLLKPIGYRPGEKYPLAVNMHGGPHVMWGPSMPEPWLEWQTHAARGYAVFFCNPRGSEGYGETHTDAIKGDWPTLAQHDILSGVEAVIGQGFVDKKRLALTGGSYAGYMTAWLIAHDQRFVCAWSQRGLYNLISFYGVTDVPQLIEREYTLTSYADIQTLWKHSPLAYVQDIHTPVVLEHQEQDYRCPISEAEQLYSALKRLGRTVVFIRYPREGHEMSRSGEPRHRVDRLNRMTDWFDQYCRPRKNKRK